MTDEQVEAMMDAAGIEAGEPESAEAALARGERPPAPVPSLPSPTSGKPKP